MMRTLYLQCDSGISGDMVVGALLDLGASESGLQEALRSLGLPGYGIRITRKAAGALDACDFDVVVDDEVQNHDHDMEWLYGDDISQIHNEDAHGSHEHHHDGRGGHEHHHEHHHEHRNLADIKTIIERSNLSERARKVALAIFEVIAEAEAKAHGQTVDTVHFHEVGAIDSIVDVAAVAWCVDDLGIDDAYIPELAEGEGHVRCAHGILPIPVPAVANIVEAHGLVIKQTHRMGELVTPTGAAIAAVLGTRASLPERYRLIATGIGTGKRAYDPPSSVRALLVEAADDTFELKEPPLWKLETEVDDCTGEALGYVLERLYELGAREAHFVPVFMKKSRPGYKVEIICEESRIVDLENALFEETTTIGIRRYPIERTVLARKEGKTETPFGQVRTKNVVLPSGDVREYPEHDSVAAIAREQAVSYQDVLRSMRL